MTEWRRCSRSPVDATSGGRCRSRCRTSSSPGCSTPAGCRARRRTRQPWTFVVPTSRDRVERLAEAVYVPDNLRRAGLVVAIVVRGKGPVLFDGGRAAQNMLLAAWSEGLASCPNGIKDADLARAALDLDEEETPGDRAHVRPARAPARPGAAHGRGVERTGEPEADRRRRAQGVVRSVS